MRDVVVLCYTYHMCFAISVSTMMRMTIATMDRNSPFIEQNYVSVTIFMDVFITKLIFLNKVLVNIGATE